MLPSLSLNEERLARGLRIKCETNVRPVMWSVNRIGSKLLTEVGGFVSSQVEDGVCWHVSSRLTRSVCSKACTCPAGDDGSVRRTCVNVEVKVGDVAKLPVQFDSHHLAAPVRWPAGERQLEMLAVDVFLAEAVMVAKLGPQGGAPGRGTDPCDAFSQGRVEGPFGWSRRKDEGADVECESGGDQDH